MTRTKCFHFCVLVFLAQFHEHTEGTNELEAGYARLSTNITLVVNINDRDPNVMAASCFIFKWHLIVTLAFADPEAGLIVNKIQSFAKNPPVIGTRQYQ